MRKMNLLGGASLLSFIGVAAMGMLTVHAQQIQLTPTGNGLYNTGVQADNSTLVPGDPTGAANPADLHYTVTFYPDGTGSPAPTPPYTPLGSPGPVVPPPATYNPISGSYGTPVNGPAFVAFPTAVDPYDPGAQNWAPAVSPSQWITYEPNMGTNADPAGTVLQTNSTAVTVYQLNLTHIPVGQIVTIINSTVASDDNVTIYGNGTKLFSNYGQLDNGATNETNYDALHSGTNTLTAPLTFVSSPTGTGNVLDFVVYNNGGYATGLDADLTGSYTPIQLLGLNLTPNQHSVLNYINQINVIGSFDPSFGNLITTFLNLDPGSYPVALDELSPEKLSIFSSLAFNNASFMTFDLDDYLAHRRDDDGSFQADTGIDSSGLNIGNPTLDPKAAEIESHLQTPDSKNIVSDAKNDVVATTPPSSADRWNVFIRGNIILSQDFSNFDLGNENATTSSFMIGGDYQLNEHFLAGLFFDYSHTDASLDSFGSSATVDSYSPGIYASYAQDGWYGNAMAYYSRNSYTEERNININDTFVETTNGATGGNQETAYVSGGYDFHKNPWTYGPTLGFQYVHLDVSGFTESGGDVADLTVNNEFADSFRSRLGGHVIYTTQAGGVVFTPFLDASWQHEFLDDSRRITSSFSQIGDGSFIVYTQDTGRESALLTTGANFDIGQKTTLFLNYQAQVTPNYYFGQSVLAGVKWAF